MGEIRMIWDFEERVEDAFVAFLRAMLPGTYKVYAAWGAEVLQFPAVVVACDSTRPTSEDAQFDPNRMATVTVSVMTEAIPEVNDIGVVTATARERNRVLRAAVYGLVFTDTLAADVNKHTDGRVIFAMAQANATTRDVDAERRLLVSAATVDVIACPLST